MGTRMSNVPVDEAHIYIYAIMHCGCIGIPVYLMVVGLPTKKIKGAAISNQFY